MVVSNFFVLDKDVLGMPFLTMSNIDINFQAWDLQWRSYTIGDVLLTIRRVELIEKKEFAVVALDPEYKPFVVYVATLSIDSGDEMHPSRKAQIAYLKANEALTKVPSKYIDFADVFSLKLTTKLPEHTRINIHAIELVDDQQTPYGLIYSLGPVELETLKAYIKNTLANSFIRPSNSLTEAPILFDKKPDGSLRLYIDYWSLNNLIIKNWYPLLLVRKSWIN